MKRSSALVVSALLISSLSTATGCVGNSKTRRGGPEAAYGGPMVLFQGDEAATTTGRVQIDDNGGVKMAWAGTSASVRFKGTAVSAEISDNGKNHYLVVVDGKPMREKIVPASGRSTVSLVKGLKRGEHTVTLYRLNEPLVGTSTLHGFILDDYGELLPSESTPRPRIEIIGDSISTGYGNEGTNEKCGFSTATQNHFLTYGARAARALNADVTTLAWSGKGVFTNRGSTSDTVVMPALWSKTLPAEGVEHSFDEAPPRAVVINLGTNDFAPEVADNSPFEEAYGKLLASVRERYPKAHLFLTVGPLLSDTFPEGKTPLSTVRAALSSLVERQNDGGDDKVHFIEFAPVTQEEGYGCDWHPSVRTHSRMAATLVRHLREAAGFE